MGRLENIIARNQRRHRPNERLIASVVFGLVVLLILALAVLTDLGVPPHDGPPRMPGAPASGTPAAPASARPEDGKRIDGVLLRSAPRAPGAPAAR